MKDPHSLKKQVRVCTTGNSWLIYAVLDAGILTLLLLQALTVSTDMTSALRFYLGIVTNLLVALGTGVGKEIIVAGDAVGVVLPQDVAHATQ